MAENKGGQIGAELTLDTNSFAKGLEDANKKAADWIDKMEGAFGRLGAGNLGGAFGILSGAGGFAGMATAAGAVGVLATGISELVGEMHRLNQAGNQNISQQQRLADRYGVTADAAAALQLQARQMGLGQDEVAGGLSHLTRLLAEAQEGTERARRAFGHLGLDISSLSGDPTRALNQITVALARLNPAQQQQAIRELVRGNQEFGQVLARIGRGGGLDAVIAASGGALPTAAQRAEGLRARNLQLELNSMNAVLQTMRENEEAGMTVSTRAQHQEARMRLENALGVTQSEQSRTFGFFGSRRPVGRAVGALSLQDLLNLTPEILEQIRSRQGEIGAQGELPADIMQRLHPTAPAASPAEQAQMRARRFYAQLQEDEDRLGLNRSPGLATGASFGSAAAINTINVANLESQSRTIEARVAARDQSVSSRNEQLANDVAGILRYLEDHPQPQPANVN